VLAHALDLVRGDQVSVALERLLRGVDERFGLIPELGEALPELVRLLELLGIRNELVDLGFSETARGANADGLRAPRAEVLRLDGEDAVCVDAERHLDLR